MGQSTGDEEENPVAGIRQPPIANPARVRVDSVPPTSRPGSARQGGASTGSAEEPAGSAEEPAAEKEA